MIIVNGELDHEAFNDEEVYTIARIAVIGICIGSIATSVSIRRVAGAFRRDWTSFLTQSLMHLLRYADSYLILLFAHLSMVFAGNWGQAFVLNFVCSFEYYFVLAVIILSYYWSTKKMAAPAAYGVMPCVMLTATIAALLLSCLTAFPLAFNGWLGPASGSESVGFYFLNDKALAFAHGIPRSVIVHGSCLQQMVN